VFKCKRFENLREDLKKASNVNLLPSNIMKIMRQSEETVERPKRKNEGFLTDKTNPLR